MLAQLQEKNKKDLCLKIFGNYNLCPKLSLEELEIINWSIENKLAQRIDFINKNLDDTKVFAEYFIKRRPLMKCLLDLFNKYGLFSVNHGKIPVNEYPTRVSGTIINMESALKNMSMEERKDVYKRVINIRESITNENWNKLHELRILNGSIPLDFYSSNSNYIQEKAGLIRDAIDQAPLGLNNILPYLCTEIRQQPYQYYENRDVRLKLIEAYDCILYIIEQLFPNEFNQKVEAIDVKSVPIINQKGETIINYDNNDAEFDAAIEDSKRDEEQRQKRIRDINEQLANTQIPSTSITFNKLGELLAPATNDGDIHEIFKSIAGYDEAIRELRNASINFNPNIAKPAHTIIQLMYFSILGKSNGIYAKQLNDKEFLNKICKRYEGQIKTYLNTKQQQLKPLLVSIIIFLKNIIPDNYPYKDELLRNILEDALVTAALAHSDNEEHLKENEGWSCPEGTFQRLIISLGRGIRSLSSESGQIVEINVESINREFTDAYISGKFGEFLNQRDVDELGDNLAISQLFTDNLIRILMQNKRLTRENPMYDEIVTTIYNKCLAWLNANRIYFGGKNKKKIKQNDKSKKNKKSKRNKKPKNSLFLE